MRKPRLYLVPFSHMDLGWTYYAGRNLEKICEKLGQIIEGFVARIEANPESRFTGLGQFHNFSQIAAHKPELLKRIRRLLAEGRMDIPGHQVNSPNLGGAEFHVTPESIVRNLIEGRRLHQRILGKSDSTVIQFPDVTGSFGNLPQLLRQAGYENYHFDRGWKHQEFPESSFVWQGIDGSEVIAERPARCSELPDLDSDACKSLKRQVEKCAENDTALLFQIGRDLGEAEGDEVAFCKEWNRRNPDLPACVSTFAGYSAAVRTYRQKLPRFQGTIDPIGWTAAFGMHGYRERRAWGGLFDTIQEVETFAASGDVPYPERQLRRAWLTGLCFQEHGAANFLIGEDHEQVYGDLDNAHRRVETLRDTVLHARAAHLAVGEADEFDSPAQTVAVFNPLPWTRCEPVEFTARFAPSDSVTGVEVVDATGSRVESQPLKTSCYPQGGLREARLVWMADVPTGGEAIYRIRPVAGIRTEAPTVEEMPEWYVLENDHLCAEFRWGVVNKLRGQDGRPFCVSGAVEHQGESVSASLGTIGVRPAQPPDSTYNWGIVNRFGKLITLMSFPFRMDLLEDGPLRTKLRVARELDGDSLSVTYTLVAGRPALDMDVGIDTQRSGYRWEMAIPFLGLNPRWQRDESFGVSEFDPGKHKYVDVGEAMTPGGFFCQSYVDVGFGDSARGLTVLTPNQPGFIASKDALQAVLLTTAPNRFEDRTCRFVMSPGTLSLGHFDFNYRLWSREGDASHAPARRAMEMRFPLRSVEAVSVKEGRKPGARFSIGPDNVVCSAFYVDNGRKLLRIYECEGRACDAEIRIEGASRLLPVDLQDRATGEPIEEEGGAFSVRFFPFRIRTFVVE